MNGLVRTYPVASLTLLAMALAATPLVAVSVGLLPLAASQLGALSASLAALILAGVGWGRAGIRELLKRVLIWRVGFGWWAFVLLFPIFPSVLALYLYQAIGGPVVHWNNLKPISGIVPMIVVLSILAGLGEEFGWRGFALPRLQARFNALQSSLIVGALWGIWHIPLFLAEGTSQHAWLVQGGWLLTVGGYIIYCMAWSIQYTWVFNNTGGSVLIASVMHGAGNAWIGGYIDVYSGEIGGILTFTAVMVVVSAVIVLIAGPTNLSRSRSKSVLPGLGSV